jgi:DNA-binding PadR family transcriptional regulator
MTPDSTLAYALLGLLHGAPQAGYDLRKTFASTPLAHFSDSPGAIYPALRRLARRRWVAAVAAPRSGRRRKVFAPTDLGRRAFAQWLGQAPTRDDVVREWDVLMLRLAFLGAVGGPRLTAFLRGVESELRAYLGELEAYRAGHAAKMPLGARLAFDSGVEGYRAQARWVARALDRTRRERRT